MKDQPTEQAPAKAIVLIANIGNRNVTYELAGQEMALPDLFQREGNRFDFRARTRQLAQDWAAKPLDIHSPFSVQIFADHLRPDVTAAHLFVTDQQTVEFPEGHQQDTLYAGELCRRVLEEQHSTATTLHSYTGDPTDEDAIYAYMGLVMRSILARYPAETHEIHFVDAGGTPGMKTVAKSLLRYYRPAVQIVYTPQAGKARAVGHQQHDKYVLLHVAQQFVRNYNYAGALSVLRQVDKVAAVSGELVALLQAANCRKHFDHAGAQKAVAQIRPERLPTIFTPYLTGKVLAGAIPFDKDFQEPRNRFDIFEIATLCELHLFQCPDLPLGVLTFIRLCEEMGQNFAEERGVLPRSDDKRSEHKKQEAFLVATQPWLQKQNVFKKLTSSYGVPYLIAYLADSCASDTLGRLLFRTAVPTLQYINPQGKSEIGINQLRNLTFLTHRNEAITAERIDKYAPGFLEQPNGPASLLLAGLGLPATNIYDQMNAEILALFAQE